MKIIRRTGMSASVGRIVRAKQQANADANLRNESEKPSPVYWSCRLTGSKVYYR